MDRFVAAARDGSAEVPPAPPSAKKAKSPTKPSPPRPPAAISQEGQVAGQTAARRPEDRDRAPRREGAIQETLEAPQSCSDARSAFGKLRHSTKLDDGGSLELRVGGVAKLSTKDEKKKKAPPKKKAPAGPIPLSACPPTQVEGRSLPYCR